MFNFINSWNSGKKQFDKIKFEIRISFLTLINIEGDWSRSYFKLVLFDFGFEIKDPSKENVKSDNKN